MMSETEFQRESPLPAPVVTGAPEINQIADPGPLGLGAFAATTFYLSMVNAGWHPAAVAGVFPLALFYGGIAQVLAGMWEFRNNRNTFGAVAFTSYGAFWLALWGLFNQVILKGAIPPAEIGHAVGLFLLAWTIFTFYMWLGSFRLNGALVGVFTLLFLTFILLTIGNYYGKSGIVKLGGWTGVITAILAWYTAAAGVVNHTFKKVVIPVFPIG